MTYHGLCLFPLTQRFYPLPCSKPLSHHFYFPRQASRVYWSLTIHVPSKIFVQILNPPVTKVQIWNLAKVATILVVYHHQLTQTALLKLPVVAVLLFLLLMDQIILGSLKCLPKVTVMLRIFHRSECFGI